MFGFWRKKVIDDDSKSNDKINKSVERKEERAKTSMDILDADYDDFERKIVNGETFVLK